jgi:hypothetical protein
LFLAESSDADPPAALAEPTTGTDALLATTVMRMFKALAFVVTIPMPYHAHLTIFPIPIHVDPVM